MADNINVDKTERGEKMVRTLHEIAVEIEVDWSSKGKGVNYAARPYLDAMKTLGSITENYIMDSGSSIVIYFLSNANTWRGEVAKRVKKELNAMVKATY